MPSTKQRYKNFSNQIIARICSLPNSTQEKRRTQIAVVTAFLQVHFAAERPVVDEFVFTAKRQNEMRFVLTVAQRVGIVAAFAAETQFGFRAAERVTNADSCRQISELKIFPILNTQLSRKYYSCKKYVS